jgi:hypothetical protein
MISEKATGGRLTDSIGSIGPTVSPEELHAAPVRNEVRESSVRSADLRDVGLYMRELKR